MVKLIRLATNNNGVFRSAFGSSITIKENSKIALLNLTFKTDFNVLNINDSNNEITFQAADDDLATLGTAYLPTKTYTQANIDDLKSDIEFALNETLELDPNVVSDSDLNSTSSAFQIRMIDDLINISYRYAPFLNPFNNTSTQEPFPTPLLMKYKPTSLDVTVPGGGGSETEVSQITGELPVLLRQHNALLTTQYTFSKGSGMYYARIADFTDNGSGLQNNGAGIGLCDTPFFNEEVGGPGDNIPLTKCTYEVRFNRLTETYEYIVDGDDPLDSGVLPTVVSLATSGSVALHDVMFIEKNGSLMEVGVYQNVGGTATRQVFGTGSNIVEQGKEYWSYLFVRGAKTDIKLDMVNISINPFNDPDDFNDFDWDDNLGSTDASALENGYGDLTASVNPSPGFIMPKLLQDRWDDIPAKLTSIKMNKTIWKAIGFNTGIETIEKLISDQSGLIGWTALYIGNAVSELVGSDNFIVLSDTLPLDSYDASKVFYTEQDNSSGNVAYNPETERLGRRKNILMTIPENNNSDGLVEFQTNTPIFIDINNVHPMNIRNLQFRILNKDFSPINEQQEQAIMTILLD